MEDYFEIDKEKLFKWFEEDLTRLEGIILVPMDNSTEKPNIIKKENRRVNENTEED